MLFKAIKVLKALFPEIDCDQTAIDLPPVTFELGAAPIYFDI
jgi:hypothetical protein